MREGPRNDCRLHEGPIQRGEQFENKGHRFGRALDREMWWYAEMFQFLKASSRSAPDALLRRRIEIRRTKRTERFPFLNFVPTLQHGQTVLNETSSNAAVSSRLRSTKKRLLHTLTFDVSLMYAQP
jgi:hypothetical protein